MASDEIKGNTEHAHISIAVRNFHIDFNTTEMNRLIRSFMPIPILRFIHIGSFAIHALVLILWIVSQTHIHTSHCNQSNQKKKRNDQMNMYAQYIAKC